MSKEIVKPFEHENYTQIKNCVLDEIMPRISSSAWKVLCVIMRQTWGWEDRNSPTGRKQWDWISYSQFRKKTGIATDTTISKALKECMAAEYILKHKSEVNGQDRYYYSLNHDLEIEVGTSTESVEPLYRKCRTPSTGNVDTKESITKENNTIPEPGVVPAGEEFSPRKKITKVGRAPSANITPLSPSTPGAEFMFEKLGAEARAKHRNPPRRFGSLVQKDMFEKAEGKVGEGKVKEFVLKALAVPILSVKGTVAYVNACTKEKPRAKAGEVLDAGEWCEGMQPRLKAGETLVIPSRPPPTSINPGG